MKKGFTLIEMLVVIGIIAVLVGASLAGFSKMTKSADKAKARELVSNVATALTALYQREGSWPKALLNNGATDGLLDANAAVPLAKGKYMSLTTANDENGRTKLAGLDRFGIVTHWATAAIKRMGVGASLATKVANTDKTVQDHILHYALDVDGDGIISGASVGGESIDVRATAIVWCCGRDGVIETYTKGRRSDDIYSWSYGQTQNVK